MPPDPGKGCPFAVERIDHIVLRVRDLDASIAFYRDILGCEVVWRRERLGLVHLRAGASMIDLLRIDGPPGHAAARTGGRNLDHVCLRIEPFDEVALVAHLARHGLAPAGPAALNFGAEGEGWSLYLSDPDGNTLELKGASAAAGGSAAG